GQPMSDDVGESATIRPAMFETDTQFWFETLRVLGRASYEGADLSDAIRTAHRIPRGDHESWYEPWRATAERVEAEAREQLLPRQVKERRRRPMRRNHFPRQAATILRSPTPPPTAPPGTHLATRRTRPFRPLRARGCTDARPDPRKHRTARSPNAIVSSPAMA
ncbi:MAG: hypothetical protein ACRDPA_03360, partial [Solirubrobacteraceae bacterium]